MSDKFFQFIERVLSHEGGYANHPKDPGGETNWGVTKRTAQANGYTGSMRAMTRSLNPRFDGAFLNSLSLVIPWVQVCMCTHRVKFIP